MGISIVLILVGLSLSLYSPVCQYYYTVRVEKTINEFENRIKNAGISNEKESEETENHAFDQLYRLIVQYNKKLYETKQKNLIDPFSYEQVDFNLKQFGFEDDMIGYITIPKIDIKLPIYLGANKENMKKGAVHLTQTSLPIGGLNTNAVIAAHRGINTAAMFREIQKLEINDEITITNFRETLVYRVTKVKIINPTDIDEIFIQDGRDLVTLITCHPYRHNYQRYVVYCEHIVNLD